MAPALAVSTHPEDGRDVPTTRDRRESAALPRVVGGGSIREAGLVCIMHFIDEMRRAHAILAVIAMLGAFACQQPYDWASSVAPGCDGACNAGGDFGVAAVSDDLDDHDASIVSDGLAAMGLRFSVQAMDVTSASLRTILEQDLGTLYFTGHGREGRVLTADGELGAGDVVIATENTVFATCLTLATSWDEALGPSAQTLLGYSDTTLDFVDNEVAIAFVEALAAGSPHIAAWFVANAQVESTFDRWVGYAREGGTVVEYSARSRRTPVLGGMPEDEAGVEFGTDGRVRVARALLDDDSRFERGVARAVARAGEVSSGVVSGGWDGLGATSMTSSQAEVAAEDFVGRLLGGLPPDASVPVVTPLTARGPGASAAAVGYVVRYARQVEGLPVLGNGVADHVVVLVADAGVVAWSRYWPGVDVLESAPWQEGSLLSPGEAIRAAGEAIAASVKGELDLSWARPVYGTRGPGAVARALVPAWEFGGRDGTSVVVDAVDGSPLL